MQDNYFSYLTSRHHSPGEMAGCVAGWDQEHQQLDVGSQFVGDTVQLQLGSVKIVRQTVNLRTMNAHSRSDDTFCTYFIPNPVTGRFAPDSLVTCFNIRRRPRFGMRPAGLPAIMVEMPFELVDMGNDDVWGNYSHLPSGAVWHLVTWLNSMLDPVHGQALRANPEFLSVAPNLIIDRLTLWLATKYPKANRETKRVFERASEWIRTSPSDKITVVDVSMATGCNPATLRKAFLDEADVSLDRYLTIRRLNFARNDILSTENKKLRISDVALSRGFSHWGRFSELYRSFFRETPSDTARAKFHSFEKPIRRQEDLYHLPPW